MSRIVKEAVNIKNAFEDQVKNRIENFKILSDADKIKAIKDLSWYKKYNKFKIRDKDDSKTRREKEKNQAKILNWTSFEALGQYVDEYLAILEKKSKEEERKAKDANYFYNLMQKGKDEYLETSQEILKWLKKHTKRIDLIMPIEPDEVDMNELGAKKGKYQSMIKARDDAFDYINNCKTVANNFEPKESNQLFNSFELIVDDDKDMPMTLKNASDLKNTGVVGQWENKPLYNKNNKKFTGNNFIRFLIDNYDFYLGEQPR